jgi:pimeloyl-ACP methyl ester carboxylesterase
MKQIIPKIIGFLLNIFTLIAPRVTRNYAFELLSRVKRVAVSEEGRQFFASGQTHWLNVFNEKTALHQWGFGPKKVLFLHGWMSHSQRWSAYVASLDPAVFTAYALDAPGHGVSKGKKLNLERFREAYVQALKVTGELDTVVCHSFGNLAVIYQYLLDPEVKVKSYVLMGSPSGMEAILNYFIQVFGVSPAMLKNLCVRIDEVLKMPHESINLANFFSKVDQPVLVVHEETDTITPIEPIKQAVLEGNFIETYYTSGLNHTLKDEAVVSKIKNFIVEHSNELAHVY